MAGFMDFLTSDGMNLAGGLLGAGAGLSNSIVSLTELSDEKKGTSTAITGGIGLLAGLQGLASGYKDKQGGKQFDGVMGIINGALGAGTGALDVVSGSLAATGHKTTAGGFAAASGILGALGGIGGVVQGIGDIKRGWEIDPTTGKRNKKQIGKGILGGLAGLAGLGGGIAGTVAGVAQAQGGENKDADKASGGLGIIGNLLGGVGSFFG